MVFHCEILCIMCQLHFSGILKHLFLLTTVVSTVDPWLLIRCLLVRSHYLRKHDTITLVLGPHFWITFLWYVCITYWNKVTATFRFCLLLRRNFITSQLRYLFVQMVSFFDDFRITLNYGNCWNVWIAYGNYVIKWWYFSYIIF